MLFRSAAANRPYNATELMICAASRFLEDGALVPVVFVTALEGSGDERRVVIDPPEGLFDLGVPD